MSQSSFAPKTDISRIDRYAPAELIGREAELKLLDDAWAKAIAGEPKRPHVLTFVALGGEGKTSLVAKWLAQLAHQDWPGCDAVFAWSFYSQGTRDQLAASSDLFLKEALLFFGDSAMAASAQNPFDKGRRLAQLIGEQRALLILDGLEPLQYAPTSPTPGELKDHGLSALLKGLAATTKGLCVVTTRYSLPDLKAFWQTTAPEKKLLRLSRAAGVHLLKSLGVKGTTKEFEALVEDVKGHALTLQIMGGFLKRAFQGDIRCRDRVKFEKADEKIDGGHAFRAMAAYEKWLEGESDESKRELAILRLLGLFDRPATSDCVSALIKAPTIAGLTDPLVSVAQDDWQFSLDALDGANLLAVNRDSFSAILSLDTHPHIREYFSKQLRERNPEAWRAANRRLYEHLCATMTDKKPNPTLEDLQPLYQAVAHGCQATLHEKALDYVYIARIQREDEAYTTKKLGAFGSDLGAVACFFEVPWNRLSPLLTETDQAWILNETASSLRALCRLTEAVEPMQAGLENYAKRKNWQNAAIAASNLSELDLTLGDVSQAVHDAERALAFADRSDDGNVRYSMAFERPSGDNMRYGMSTVLADALHQAGHRHQARARFREAEEARAEIKPTGRKPEYPILYSLQGFLYCDLLLAAPELAAWKIFISSPADSNTSNSEVAITCRGIWERAMQTLKIAKDNNLSLFSIAIDNLTLSRAALYAAIADSTNSPLATAIPHTTAAVDGLRRAGTQDYLPRGLLTRAWLRIITGPRTGHESAQSDLDEAWEIAERGPMRLFMADIHLYRARLFFREREYPWQSPAADLDAAEQLINSCGYHRRDEELADAKQAILGQ